MKDASKIILSFNEHLSAESRELKFAALQENIFRFYRGTCHLFYDRLSSLGMPKDHTRTWICGDLHLENFGSYKGDNRLVYFDINDFDEALLGLHSFDVMRLVTAILLASEDFKYSERDARALALLALGEYAKAITTSKALMMEREVAKGLMRDFFDQVSQQSREAFIDRITRKNGKKLHFHIDDVHNKKTGKALHDDLIKWFEKEFHNTDRLSDMKVLDCAHRIAGTGSIGCERYMLLVYDRRRDKNYVLDMKEARPSSLRGHVAIKQPKWDNEAERIVSIQDRMQFCAPALLRAVSFQKKWFVLRELQPVQDKMNLMECKGRMNKLDDILTPMAEITAYAHLRGSGRQSASTADELADAVSKTKWIKHMYEISHDLSVQIRKDYLDFRAYMSR